MMLDINGFLMHSWFLLFMKRVKADTIAHIRGLYGTVRNYIYNFVTVLHMNTRNTINKDYVYISRSRYKSSYSV